MLEKCCEKVELSLLGDANTALGSLLNGQYSLGSSDVHGKQHWVSQDGSKAMWFQGEVWIVGEMNQLGSDEGDLILEDDEVQCPNQSTEEWEFREDGSFHDAELTLECDSGNIIYTTFNFGTPILFNSVGFSVAKVFRQTVVRMYDCALAKSVNSY